MAAPRIQLEHQDRQGMGMGCIGARSGVRPLASVVTALSAGALLLVGACTPSPQPTSTGTTSATASTSPTATTSTTSDPPTSSVPTTDPGIPPAARENTIAGAEAFVRYFFVSMNQAYVSSSSQTLRALVAPACPACTAIIADIDDQAAQGHHAAGDVARVKSVVGVTPELGMAKVEAHTDQLPVAILDASGRTVDVNPATPSNLLFTLTWSNRWVVARLQVIG